MTPHVLTLADVPLDPERLKKLKLEGSVATWASDIQTAIEGVHSNLKELALRGLELVRPERDERWRLKKAALLEASCLEAIRDAEISAKHRRKPLKGKARKIPTIIKAIVRAVVEWLEERSAAVASLRWA